MPVIRNGNGLLTDETIAGLGRTPLIKALKICVSLGRRSVLESVDIEVHAGEIVTLVGLNGAGKSTLVRILLGIIQPDEGTVERRPGLKIGYSPQRLRRDPIFPVTVRRFLTLGTPFAPERLEAVLQEVGASAILSHPMAEVSGGELHRVLLARALLRNPELLVLDEPLAGVDIASQSELYGLLTRIRDRYGCGILLVSHDLHLVMKETDKVVCLNKHVCCSGTPREIARDPAFSTLFGKHISEWLAAYSHSHDHRHDALEDPAPPNDKEES